MRIAVVFLAAVCLCVPLLAQPQSPGGTPDHRVHIATESPEALCHLLEHRGYDCGHGPHGAVNGALEVFVSNAELAALQGAGLEVQIVESSRPLDQKFGGEGLPTGYRDLAAILATLQNAQSSYPNLAYLEDIAATHGPGATHEGRPIWALKISDNASVDEDEPNLLIVSNHHAREIVTPELALEIIDTLLVNYGSDPVITALVDRYEIWVAPTWNPDGLDYCWTTNNNWRKNRKPVSGGQVGVDLNRNYPLAWDGACGGSTTPSSGTYRGPSAASEEETQTMLAWSEARRWAKVLDFHSTGREVLQGYRCSPLPPQIDAYIDSEAVNLGNLATYGTRDPSAEGEHYEWQIASNTTWSFLVETQTAFQPAYSAALAEFTMVWPLVLEFMDRPIPVSGHVLDSNGSPIEADIEILGLGWQLGETRRSHPTSGRYQLFLPDGSWQLRFTAPGHDPVVQTVIVDNTQAQVVNVNLPGSTSFDLVLEHTAADELRIGLRNIPTGTTQGLFLASLDTQGPLGAGPFAGLYPDLLTFDLAQIPAAPGGLASWLWPVPAPLFPASDFVAPLQLVPLPAGTVLDGLGAAFGPQIHVSPVRRVTL